MTKIAIIGFGTVGSGVYEVIRKNASLIEKNAGDKIDIKYILDIRDFSNHEESHLFVNDVNVIAKDDEVKIVVETMGGLEPANTFTRLMLENGKTVVTSNKELVATYGDELFEIAIKNNVSYYYEASVGGGIPVISPLKNCLGANEIESVYGILNGTTNYILTRMFSENVAFSDALKEAQEKGYAEKDPTADVDGLDTGKKISILSSMINGQKVDFNDVHTEGIRNITLTDVKMSEMFGYSIKLIGLCKKTDDKYAVVVAPMLVSEASLLANVSDVFNAVVFNGNMLGESLFYGKGAGKEATASAVVSDVIDGVKNASLEFKAPWVKATKNSLIAYDDIETQMYVCIKANDEKKIIDYISDSFGMDIKTAFIDDNMAFILPKDKISNINNKLNPISENITAKLMILE